jgi:hypothetical protein
MPVLIIDRRKNPAVVLHSSPNDDIRLPKKIKDVPVVVFQGKIRKVKTYRIGKDVVVRPGYLKQRGLRWDEKLRIWLGLSEQTEKTIFIPA